MKKIYPYAAIIASLFFWGLSYISSKVCLRYVTPIALVTLRTTIAALVLTILWRVNERHVVIKKKDFGRFFISGLLGINCYFMFEVIGLMYTSPSIVAIILASIPIISLIVGRFILKTKMGIFKILGVVLSLIGVALVIGVDIDNFSSGNRGLGYLFVFLAAASWVGFSYVTKPLYKDYSPLTIATVQIISGALVFIPVFILTKQTMPKFDFTFTFNLLYLALICSATAILLYIFAMKKLGVVTTTLYINVLPIITVGASAIVLKEFLGTTQMVGGLLIIGAVYLSSVVIKPKKNLDIENSDLSFDES